MARVSNSSVAAGTALTQDIQLGGSEWLAVVGVVGNAANAATAAGDVIIWAQPYLDDAVNNNLPTLADITMSEPEGDFTFCLDLILDMLHVLNEYEADFN